jgi:ATP-binding cassette subfamily C protein CydC
VAELQVAIVGVRFFGISRGVFRYLERLASHSVSLQVLTDLRVWFYTTIERLAPAGLQPTHSGDLLARAVSDIDTLKDFFVRVIAPPLVGICIALGFGFFLSFYSPLLTFAVWAAMLFIGVAVPLLTHRLSHRAQATWVAARASIAQIAIDGVQGLADLLANNAGRRHLDRTGAIGVSSARAETQLAWIGGLHSALSTFGVHFGGWLVLLLAIPLVGNGQISGVALAVVTLGTVAAFEAVLPFAQSAQALQSQLSSARRLFDIADFEPPVREPMSSSPMQPASSQLSIHHLSFAYGNNPPVLADLSLELTPGKKIAILGPSGAGKSTLLNLLLRFWDFDQGEITLGGVDIRCLPPDYVRSQFAIVPQQVHIFNATIEDNLRLAKPDATAAELADAAHRVHLLHFIEAQPDGWQTWTGEHGLRLSGGERQRLGVARALLCEAPILLLDEFTTHLDPATASKVMGEAMASANERSVLLITHSKEQLEDFEAVYGMRDGRLSLIT